MKNTKKRLQNLQDLSHGEHSLEEVFGKAGFMRCPTCGAMYVLPEEIEMIKEVGECSKCDHVRGELNA